MHSPKHEDQPCDYFEAVKTSQKTLSHTASVKWGQQETHRSLQNNLYHVSYTWSAWTRCVKFVGWGWHFSECKMNQLLWFWHTQTIQHYKLWNRDSSTKTSMLLGGNERDTASLGPLFAASWLIIISARTQSLLYQITWWWSVRMCCSFY